MRVRNGSQPTLDQATPNVRCGSSLCENSYVELARRNSVSITLSRKRTALAVTVEGGLGRKQFCALSARARFHTAWTLRRHRCPQIGPTASREAEGTLEAFGEACHRKRRPRTTRTAPYPRLSLNAEAGGRPNGHAGFTQPLRAARRGAHHHRP